MNIVVRCTMNYGDQAGVCYPETKTSVIDVNKPIINILRLASKFSGGARVIHGCKISIEIPDEYSSDEINTLLAGQEDKCRS